MKNENPHSEMKINVVLCPKCGSEMRMGIIPFDFQRRILRCEKCGHEEKVKEAQR